jgi:hypothetical protein
MQNLAPILPDLVGPGGSPFVLALTELVAITFPNLPRRFLPLVAVIIGVAVNEYLAVVLSAGVGEAVGYGVLAGLVAVGMYSTVSNLRGGASTSESTKAIARSR